MQTNDEQGFALFYSLLVTLVVGGIVAVVFATSITETRQSALELDFEDTVHVAEASAERLLQQLQADATIDSGVTGPGAGDHAAWAINEALRVDGAGAFVHDVIDVGEGESVALRPDDDDREFIFGVGFVPSRDAVVAGVEDAYTRVVRVQVAFTPSAFSAQDALLAGGSLKMNGSFDIGGTSGSVHTNGALQVSGTSGEVAQGITYTGTCAMSPCTGTADAPISGPLDPKPVPEVNILNTWATPEAKQVATEGDWYDYCSGTWYQRGPLDAAPCTGTVMGSFPAWWPWAGTTFTGNDTGVSSIDGVFFFRDDVDLDIKRPNGSMSVLTGGDMIVGPSASAPSIDGRLTGIFLLADGDITMRANLTALELDTPAVVMSNQSLRFIGNPDTTNIAFIARDELNAGTTYSGTGDVVYNGGALPNFGGGGVPLVVQWDEVR